ncbi:MAG: hypothetical protein NW206_19090 [Hyphomonadaceae bacterium]|nr:hypothetical protein [Hyphomonadaceae bacterium]
MKMHQILAGAACAMILAACQGEAPPADTATEAPVAEAPAGPEASPIPANCAALAHRDWEAELVAGASPTLTIAGELDLPTPGYGVSLTRNDNEAADAAEAVLTLAFIQPSGIVAQVVTATPVHYFGPAKASYASVRIVCGDGDLATIPLTQAG